MNKIKIIQHNTQKTYNNSLKQAEQMTKASGICLYLTEIKY